MLELLLRSRSTSPMTNGARPSPTATIARAPAIPMKVVMVSTWETVCGIADYSASLVDALQRSSVTVDVAPVDRAFLRYLSTREIEEHYGRLVAEVPDDCDLVHIQHDFGFFGGEYGYQASMKVLAATLRTLRGRSLPVVITFHTDPSFLAERPQGMVRRAGRQLIVRRWKALAAQISRDAGIRVIVHSGTTRRILVESGFAPGSVTVIPQGIAAASAEVPDADVAAVRARMQIPADAVVLGMFGFMSAYKGYATALAAMRQLPARFHLLIIGGPHPMATESALEDVLKFIQRRPDVATRIHLTGFVPASELPAHRAAADIYLAPYHRWPILSSSAAVSWALSSRRCVVASKIPAFQEVQDNGRCLELVNPEKPRELALSVRTLADDPARRAKLLAHAATYCRANTWEQRAADHRAVYVAMSAR